MNTHPITESLNHIFGDLKMGLLKDEWLIPIGCISLALALLLDHFLADNMVLDFVIGILIGLSMALNLTGLYRSRNR